MKIIVAGDFYPNGCTGQLINDQKDYNAVLEEVRPLLKQADYSMVNLECPVVSGSGFPIEKCGPHLRTTSNGVEAIKWAGFKMANLANNHILDYGVKGLQDTEMTCRSLGLDIVGTGRNEEEASKVFYKEIKNKVLAVINCCEHEFSVATRKKAGANPLNPIRQYRRIQEAKQKADFVLVITHGGHECFQLPSLRMIETYRFFIDVGADSVINHHQHCFSGYEIYNSKPIFYGIGNFCFEKPGTTNSAWNEGYLVELDIEENISFSLHPYLQCNGNGKVEFLIDTTQFEKRLEELNAILQNPDKLEYVCAKFYDELGKHTLGMFEPYSGKYLQAAFYRGLLPSFFKRRKRNFALNQIMCESHKDKIEYLLKKTIKD